jgi:hypothetical protein
MSVVADLVEVSQGRTHAGKETRGVAWLLLVQLAREGDEEARQAIAELLCRKQGNVSKFTIKDTACRTKHSRQ